MQCEILFYRLLHPVAGIADKFVVYISLRYGNLPWISLNVIPRNIITTIIIVKWFLVVSYSILYRFQCLLFHCKV